MVDIYSDISKSSNSNSSNSNQSYHFSNNSAFSNISNDISDIMGHIIFILSQTEIPKKFEDKRKVIQKYFREKDPKNEGLLWILDAFKDIEEENPDIPSFNQHIKKLYKNFEKEKVNFDKSGNEIKDINRFIIYDILIFKYINIVCLEKAKTKHIHLKIKNDETEEKVIQNYLNMVENLINDNLKAIKDFSDLLLSRILIQVSPNEYKMAEKNLFHFIIEQIPKRIEHETIYNYFEDKKIYSFSKYLFFLIEIREIKFKYEKEISLQKYDGNKNHFFLYAIIYEENSEYITLIKNNLGEKNWKKFDNKNIENINISNELTYERPNPFILIYKKDD